ncbi:hypothetical protein MSG28_012635 [Choristoneura fumiferana]|uniref:Uncharacterized protein n=1 Tax=Choristoneura fumiferana TaxID=7141 RepID=A0ACC0JHF7_CHOFU|nr:hypothetical protein MSG28_012635 [Choristoneura fumiferana]
MDVFVMDGRVLRPLTSDLVVQIICDGNLSDFDESDLEDQFLQYDKEGGGSTSSDEDVQNQILSKPECSPHDLTSTSSHDRSSRGRPCSRGQNQSPSIIEAQSRQRQSRSTSLIPQTSQFIDIISPKKDKHLKTPPSLDFIL